MRAAWHINSEKEKYLFEPLAPNVLVELQLLLLTFSTGIQDAIAFPNFLCFASNQTGNTILLAVSISGFRADNFELPNVAMSLAMFLTGAIVTGQLGNVIGKRQRLWQILCNLGQIMMVIAAAAIQFVYGAEGRGARALAVIGMLAYTSGAQVAAAREFKLTEISTAMATAAWVDLVIDPHLLPAHNRPRDRRAFFLVVLAIGGLVGAFVRSKFGSAIALVVSAVIKALVVPMLMAARPEMLVQPGQV